MKPISASSLLVLLFLLILAAVSASVFGGDKNVTAYRYEISWDPWVGENFYEREKLGVFVNGKRIGTPPQAFDEIANLPVVQGERVKIVLQPDVKGQLLSTQPYLSSNFLQLWLAKGVLTDLFENGKKLNAHTVSWKDFLKGGNFIRNPDDAVWLVDGQPVGNGAVMAKKLKLWAKEGNVVVQYVTPLGWRPEGPTEVGVVYTTLEELADAGKIRIFCIKPDPVFSLKYLEEVIIPDSKREK